jgi:hypothetical protein
MAAIDNRAHTGLPRDPAPEEDGLITVTFKLAIHGGRTFPLPNGRSYRYDAGSNKTHTMPKRDAEMLLERYGVRTFEFDPMLR